jgi:hypothetical protein
MQLEKDGNYYYISNPKKFEGSLVNENELNLVLNFAYEMCFGVGHHRSYRTGGQYGRKGGEMFCNTFQGKLGELVLYQYFKAKGFILNEPDFGIYSKGVWDDTDLEINNKKINVKTVASQSNLLLLELDDWNEKGEYIPNLKNGSTSNYDYFILVRINPDIKKIFKRERLMYNNEINKDIIQGLISQNKWSFDIAGYSSSEEVIKAIKNKDILPQNSILNKYTTMDASNYYIQSGDMNNIDALVRELANL